MLYSVSDLSSGSALFSLPSALGFMPIIEFLLLLFTSTTTTAAADTATTAAAAETTIQMIVFAFVFVFVPSVPFAVPV